MIKKRLLRALIIASVSFFIFTSVIMPYRMDSDSGVGIAGFTFVDRVTYRFRNPTIGDQIVAKILSKNVAFVGEVIAGPGDIIQTKNETLYINDIKFPNIPLQVLYQQPKTLKPNQYLIQMITEPYNVLGVIDQKSIIGKLF